MGVINFSDGMRIRTDGDYRIIRKSDGLYVVGGGFCIPVEDEKEAKKTLDELKGEQN